MREGYLQKNSSERYELLDANGKYITYFTSGDSLEIFEMERWISGVVEYNHSINDYVLYVGKTQILLSNGLPARTE